MKNGRQTNKSRLLKQLTLSILLVSGVSVVCFFVPGSENYRIVALLLLVTVSIIAMFLDIAAVLTASILSALVWNFLFIPPVFTFHISDAEDILMFLMYFLVALINGILTFKIRQVEKREREKEEKEKVIKLYNTLLSSLSHELRTPIATIIGSVDTLKDTRDLPEQTKGILLQEIELAANRLNKQVENLLNMSRLETGMLKPRLDWVDINELIHTLIYQFADVKTHQIIFYESVEDLPLYKTDGGIIEQILYNLIQNAVLYTPLNSRIVIEADQEAENLHIEISDTGKGFPEEAIPYVFDKFYRLPNTKTSGVGLGLSIVKGYTEALNGNISLENKVEGGARFILEIPVEKTFINKLSHE
ncbi:MAG: sensor histidine kinase [Bacteroidota bacterium]